MVRISREALGPALFSHLRGVRRERREEEVGRLLRAGVSAVGESILGHRAGIDARPFWRTVTWL